MKLMSTLDRICAWFLMFAMIAYVITGFDVLGRFLSPPISSMLHLKYLYLPVAFAFTFHASYAMNLSFKRWKFGIKLRQILTGIFITVNLVLTAYFIYLEFIR